MNCYSNMKQTDNGPNPYIANIEHITVKNNTFRTAIWTGQYLQMTLMCIPTCEDIGTEVHEDTDQLIIVEEGNAMVKMGKCENRLEFRKNLCKGDAVFVPAGTWHDIVNIGNNALKVASIYAPPNHPWGTLQCTKCE